MMHVYTAVPSVRWGTALLSRSNSFQISTVRENYKKTNTPLCYREHSSIMRPVRVGLDDKTRALSMYLYTMTHGITQIM